MKKSIFFSEILDVPDLRIFHAQKTVHKSEDLLFFLNLLCKLCHSVDIRTQMPIRVYDMVSVKPYGHIVASLTHGNVSLKTSVTNRYFHVVLKIYINLVMIIWKNTLTSNLYVPMLASVREPVSKEALTLYVRPLWALKVRAITIKDAAQYVAPLIQNDSLYNSSIFLEHLSSWRICSGVRLEPNGIKFQKLNRR